MDKSMQDAPMPKITKPVGRLVGTGIKLKVIDKNTGKSVNYGVQLNNTTLEIEALSNLKITVIGFSPAKRRSGEPTRRRK